MNSPELVNLTARYATLSAQMAQRIERIGQLVGQWRKQVALLTEESEEAVNLKARIQSLLPAGAGLTRERERE